MEHYEHATDRLVANWPDMELYHSVGRQVDHMRMLGAALPQLAVPRVNLPIAHSELVHCLWRCSHRSAPSAEFAHCRSRHCAAVVVLRERCVCLFTRIED